MESFFGMNVVNKIISSQITEMLRSVIDENSGFSRNDVGVGLETGSYTLENVVLKQNLLDNLDLPIRLRYGVLGRLELSLVISQLNKEPALISIDRVMIVLESRHKFSREYFNRRVRLKKERDFELLLCKNHVENKVLNKEKVNKPKWSIKKYVINYLIQKVMKNLVVRITNIHIRFEDATSISSGYCLGLTIESLVFEPINNSAKQEESEHRSGNKKSIVSDGFHTIFNHSLMLRSFSVYLNPILESTLNPCTTSFRDRRPHSIDNLMFNSIPRSLFRSSGQSASSVYGEADGNILSGSSDQFEWFPEHHYLLKPLHADVTIDCSREPSESMEVIFRALACLTSRVTLPYSFSLPDRPFASASLRVQLPTRVCVSLESFQLRVLQELTEMCQRLRLLEEVLDYRPESVVTGHADLWWRFATRSVLHMRRGRCPDHSWRDLQRRIPDKLVYQTLWLRMSGTTREAHLRRSTASNPEGPLGSEGSDARAARRLYQRLLATGRRSLRESVYWTDMGQPDSDSDWGEGGVWGDGEEIIDYSELADGRGEEALAGLELRLLMDIEARSSVVEVRYYRALAERQRATLHPSGSSALAAGGDPRAQKRGLWGALRSMTGLLASGWGEDGDEGEGGEDLLGMMEGEFAALGAQSGDVPNDEGQRFLGSLALRLDSLEVALLVSPDYQVQQQSFSRPARPSTLLTLLIEGVEVSGGGEISQGTLQRLESDVSVADLTSWVEFVAVDGLPIRRQVLGRRARTPDSAQQKSSRSDKNLEGIQSRSASGLRRSLYGGIDGGKERELMNLKVRVNGGKGGGTRPTVGVEAFVKGMQTVFVLDNQCHNWLRSVTVFLSALKSDRSESQDTLAQSHQSDWSGGGVRSTARQFHGRQTAAEGWNSDADSGIQKRLSEGLLRIVLEKKGVEFPVLDVDIALEASSLSVWMEPPSDSPDETSSSDSMGVVLHYDRLTVSLQDGDMAVDTGSERRGFTCNDPALCVQGFQVSLLPDDFMESFRSEGWDDMWGRTAVDDIAASEDETLIVRRVDINLEVSVTDYFGPRPSGEGRGAVPPFLSIAVSVGDMRVILREEDILKAVRTIKALTSKESERDDLKAERVEGSYRSPASHKRLPGLTRSQLEECKSEMRHDSWYLDTGGLKSMAPQTDRYDTVLQSASRSLDDEDQFVDAVEANVDVDVGDRVGNKEMREGDAFSLSGSTRSRGTRGRSRRSQSIGSTGTSASAAASLRSVLEQSLDEFFDMEEPNVDDEDEVHSLQSSRSRSSGKVTATVDRYFARDSDGSQASVSAKKVEAADRDFEKALWRDIEQLETQRAVLGASLDLAEKGSAVWNDTAIQLRASEEGLQELKSKLINSLLAQAQAGKGTSSSSSRAAPPAYPTSSTEDTQSDEFAKEYLWSDDPYFRGRFPAPVSRRVTRDFRGNRGLASSHDREAIDVLKSADVLMKLKFNLAALGVAYITNRSGSDGEWMSRSHTGDLDYGSAGKEYKTGESLLVLRETRFEWSLSGLECGVSHASTASRLFCSLANISLVALNRSQTPSSSQRLRSFSTASARQHPSVAWSTRAVTLVACDGVVPEICSPACSPPSPSPPASQCSFLDLELSLDQADSIAGDISVGLIAVSCYQNELTQLLEAVHNIGSWFGSGSVGRVDPSFDPSSNTCKTITGRRNDELSEDGTESTLRWLEGFPKIGVSLVLSIGGLRAMLFRDYDCVLSSDVTNISCIVTCKQHSPSLEAGASATLEASLQIGGCECSRIEDTGSRQLLIGFGSGGIPRVFSSSLTIKIENHVDMPAHAMVCKVNLEALLSRLLITAYPKAGLEVICCLAKGPMYATIVKHGRKNNNDHVEHSVPPESVFAVDRPDEDTFHDAPASYSDSRLSMLGAEALVVSLTIHSEGVQVSLPHHSSPSLGDHHKLVFSVEEAGIRLAAAASLGADLRLRGDAHVKGISVTMSSTELVVPFTVDALLQGQLQPHHDPPRAPYNASLAYFGESYAVIMEKSGAFPGAGEAADTSTRRDLHLSLEVSAISMHISDHIIREAVRIVSTLRENLKAFEGIISEGEDESSRGDASRASSAKFTNDAPLLDSRPHLNRSRGMLGRCWYLSFGIDGNLRSLTVHMGSIVRPKSFSLSLTGLAVGVSGARTPVTTPSELHLTACREVSVVVSLRDVDFLCTEREGAGENERGHTGRWVSRILQAEGLGQRHSQSQGEGGGQRAGESELNTRSVFEATLGLSRGSSVEDRQESWEIISEVSFRSIQLSLVASDSLDLALLVRSYMQSSGTADSLLGEGRMGLAVDGFDEIPVQKDCYAATAPSASHVMVTPIDRWPDECGVECQQLKRDAPSHARVVLTPQSFKLPMSLRSASLVLSMKGCALSLVTDANKGPIPTSILGSADISVRVEYQFEDDLARYLDGREAEGGRDADSAEGACRRVRILSSTAIVSAASLVLIHPCRPLHTHTQSTRTATQPDTPDTVGLTRKPLLTIQQLQLNYGLVLDIRNEPMATGGWPKGCLKQVVGLSCQNVTAEMFLDNSAIGEIANTLQTLFAVANFQPLLSEKPTVGINPQSAAASTSHMTVSEQLPDSFLAMIQCLPLVELVVQAHLEDLYVLLVDDKLEPAVAYFKFTISSVHLVGKGGHGAKTVFDESMNRTTWRTPPTTFRFQAEGTFALDYHNISLVCWEPLLEPFVATVSLTAPHPVDPSGWTIILCHGDMSVDSLSCEGFTGAPVSCIERNSWDTELPSKSHEPSLSLSCCTVNIALVSPINLNVTMAAVLTLNSCLHSVRAMCPGRYRPSLICSNETGTWIRFKCSCIAGRGSVYGYTHLGSSESCRPVCVLVRQSLEDRSMFGHNFCSRPIAACRHLSVEVLTSGGSGDEDGVWVRLGRLSLDGTGCRLFSLDNEEVNPLARARRSQSIECDGQTSFTMPLLAADMIFTRATRCLRLRSTLSVLNTTLHAVQIGLLRPHGLRWSCVVQQGHRVAVPINVCREPDIVLACSMEVQANEEEEDVARSGSDTFCTQKHGGDLKPAAIAVPEVLGLGRKEWRGADISDEQLDSGDGEVEGGRWREERVMSLGSTVDHISYCHWLKLPPRVSETWTTAGPRHLESECGLKARSHSGFPSSKGGMVVARVTLNGRRVSTNCHHAGSVARTVELLNPLVLTNAMASLLDVRVRPVTSGNDRISIRKMSPGQTVELDAYHPLEPLWVSVRLLGRGGAGSEDISFAWSRELLVEGCGEVARAECTDNLAVVAEDGAVLFVNISTVDTDGVRALVFFVPFWLTSASSLCRAYYQHDVSDCADRADPRLNSLGGYAPCQKLEETSIAFNVLSNIGHESGSAIIRSADWEAGCVKDGDASSAEDSRNSRDAAFTNVFDVIGGEVLPVGYTDQEKGTTKLSLRLPRCHWSKGVDLLSGSRQPVEVVRRSGFFNWLDSSDRLNNHRSSGTLGDDTFSFAVGPATVLPAPFQRTRLVCVSDYYSIVNQLACPLRVRQAGSHRNSSGKGSVLEVALGKASALSWGPGPKIVQLRPLSNPGLETEPEFGWSGELSVDRLGDYLTQIRSVDNSTVMFVRMAIARTPTAGVVVVISGGEAAKPQLSVRNESSATLRLRQTNAPVHLSTLLPSATCCRWAWDLPQGSQSVLLEYTKASNNLGSSSAIWNVAGTFAFSSIGRELRKAGLVVRVQQRQAVSVLIVSDEAIYTGVPLLVPRPLPDTSSIAAWMQLCVRAELIAVSVVDSSPEELVNLSLGGIGLQLDTSAKSTSVRFSVDVLQIDDQTVQANQAVICRSGAYSPVADSEESPYEPCLRFSATQVAPYSEIMYLESMAVALAPVCLQVNSNVVIRVLEMASQVSEIVSVWEERSSLLSLSTACVDSRVIDSSLVGRIVGERLRRVAVAAARTADAAKSPALRIFFEDFRSDRGTVSLSIDSAIHKDNLRRLEDLLGSRVGASIVSVVAVLAKIHGCPLRIPEINLKRVIYTDVGGFLQAVLTPVAVSFSSQVPYVVGASSLLGSPASLVNNLLSAWRDLLVASAEGLSVSPAVFVFSVSRGLLHLLQRTLSSCLLSLSQTQISYSQLLDALSNDGYTTGIGGGITGLEIASTSRKFRKKYLEESDISLVRVSQQRSNGLVDGLSAGVLGLVLEPYRGARRNGVWGLVTGLTKGGLGLVLRPVSGALSSSSRWLDILAKQTTPRSTSPSTSLVPVRLQALNSSAGLGQSSVRTRPPKLLRGDTTLADVSTPEYGYATGLLSRVLGGRYLHEGCCWCESTAGHDRLLLLLTARRLLLVEESFQRCELVWELPLDFIVSVDLAPNPVSPIAVAGGDEGNGQSHRSHSFAGTGTTTASQSQQLTGSLRKGFALQLWARSSEGCNSPLREGLDSNPWESCGADEDCYEASSSSSPSPLSRLGTRTVALDSAEHARQLLRRLEDSRTGLLSEAAHNFLGSAAQDSF